MSAVRGCQAKFAGWRFLVSVPGDDRQGKSQRTVFIGTKELFRQVDQNELLVLLGGWIEERKRSKGHQLVEALGDFDGNARSCMSPIDTIESCDIKPAFAE